MTRTDIGNVFDKIEEASGLEWDINLGEYNLSKASRRLRFEDSISQSGEFVLELVIDPGNISGEDELKVSKEGIGAFYGIVKKPERSSQGRDRIQGGGAAELLSGIPVNGEYVGSEVETVAQDVFSQVSTSRIQLGTVDASFSDGSGNVDARAEDEGALSFLNRVVQSHGGEWYVSYDSSNDVYEFNIVEKLESGNVRQTFTEKNTHEIRDAQVVDEEYDAVVVKGYGDGDDQVVGEYPERDNWTDDPKLLRYTDKTILSEQEADTVAENIYNEHTEWRNISIYPANENELLNLGDRVEVNEPRTGINDTFRVVSRRLNLDFQDGSDIQYVLSDRPIGMIDDTEDIRDQTNSQTDYMQGSTNVWAHNENENATSNESFSMDFNIPEDVMDKIDNNQTNKVKLDYSASGFRGTAQEGDTVEVTESAAAQAASADEISNSASNVTIENGNISAHSHPVGSSTSEAASDRPIESAASGTSTIGSGGWTMIAEGDFDDIEDDKQHYMQLEINDIDDTADLHVAILGEDGTSETADFEYNPTGPAVGETVNFHSKTVLTGGEQETPAYTWRFGDGHYAIGKDVQHVYESSGDKTVEYNYFKNSGDSVSIVSTDESNNTVTITGSLSSISTGDIIEIVRSVGNNGVYHITDIDSSGSDDVYTVTPSISESYSSSASSSIKGDLIAYINPTDTATKTVTVNTSPSLVGEDLEEMETQVSSEKEIDRNLLESDDPDLSSVDVETVWKTLEVKEQVDEDFEFSIIQKRKLVKQLMDEARDIDKLGQEAKRVESLIKEERAIENHRDRVMELERKKEELGVEIESQNDDDISAQSNHVNYAGPYDTSSFEYNQTISITASVDDTNNGVLEMYDQNSFLESWTHDGNGYSQYSHTGYSLDTPGIYEVNLSYYNSPNDQDPDAIDYNVYQPGSSFQDQNPVDGETFSVSTTSIYFDVIINGLYSSGYGKVIVDSDGDGDTNWDDSGDTLIDGNNHNPDDGEVQYSGSFDVEPGESYDWFVAFDDYDAGNTYYSNMLTFHIEDVDASISHDSPSDGNLYNDGDSVTFEADIDTNVDGEAVLYVDNNEVYSESISSGESSASTTRTVSAPEGTRSTYEFHWELQHDHGTEYSSTRDYEVYQEAAKVLDPDHGDTLNTSDVDIYYTLYTEGDGDLYIDGSSEVDYDSGDSAGQTFSIEDGNSLTYTVDGEEHTIEVTSTDPSSDECDARVDGVNEYNWGEGEYEVTSGERVYVTDVQYDYVVFAVAEEYEANLSDGSHTIEVDTPDKNDSITIDVSTNDPPNADFEYSPSNPSVGEQVVFTDTSTDPDGDSTIQKWEWDWTNDGTYEETITSSPGDATHVYNSTGNKTVKLRVTDDEGATSTTTYSFDVGETDIGLEDAYTVETKSVENVGAISTSSLTAANQDNDGDISTQDSNFTSPYTIESESYNQVGTQQTPAQDTYAQLNFTVPQQYMSNKYEVHVATQLGNQPTIDWAFRLLQLNHTHEIPRQDDFDNVKADIGAGAENKEVTLQKSGGNKFQSDHIAAGTQFDDYARDFSSSQTGDDPVVSVDTDLVEGLTANNVSIIIDGEDVTQDIYGSSNSGLSQDSEIDITEFLDEDGDGKPDTGWHTIQLVPDQATHLKARAFIDHHKDA